MRSTLNACRPPPRFPDRPCRPSYAGRRLRDAGAMDTQTATTELIAASLPAAPRRPSRRTLHGTTVVDEYAWLKDANWQEVLRNPALLNPDIRAHLEAENRYTETFLGP